MADNGNQGAKGMWPSLELASRLSDVANVFFVGSLVVGVIATMVVVWTAGVKERHWDEERRSAVVRIEELKGANLRLEEEIAPRRLSKDQIFALRKAAEPFKGVKIRIESYALDAEGEILAGQIKEGLVPPLLVDNWVGAEGAGNGFAKGINVTGSNAALVDSLVRAFATVGLTEISTKPLPPPATILLALDESRSKAKDVAAVVVVGVKPIKK